MYEKDIHLIDFREVLTYFDPDPFQEWTDVGMALHNAAANGANVDVEMYEEWSKGSKKYKPGQPTQKWKSFEADGGITYKTLLGRAKDRGYEIPKTAETPGVVMTTEKVIIPAEKVSNPVYEMQTQKETPNTDTAEVEKILDAFEGKDFVAESSLYEKNLKNDVLFNSTIGKRGISKETASEYCLYPVENITVNGKRTYKRGVMAYGSFGSFIFRNDNFAPNSSKALQSDGGFKTEKAAGKKFIPIGLSRVVDKKDEVLPNGELAPVFVCEGTFDAPSFTEAVPEVDAIATGTAGGWEPIYQVYKEYDVKRPIAIIFDRDEAGDEATKNCAKIKARFSELGVRVKTTPNFIPEGIKDPNEFLLKSKDLFQEQIKHLYYGFYKDKTGLSVRENFAGFKRHTHDNAETPRIATGFPALDDDELLGGGLYPGLYVLGAVSGLGKTTFALQLADQLAATGNNVVFFSLEMSKYEMMAKSISRYTAMIADWEGTPFGYASNTRQILNPREYEKYSSTKKDLIRKAEEAYIRDLGDSLFIVEGMGSISAEGIRGTIQRLLPELSAPPIVFVDYLQILAPPGNAQKASDKQIVDANVFELKRISRDFNIPVFAVSSLNRENYKKSISMTAFKESGAIEYTSDVLLGLEREVSPENESEYEAAKKNEKSMGVRNLRLKVLKNRNGQYDGSALIMYNAKYNWFYKDRIEY